jgi:hypothetical protein
MKISAPPAAWECARMLFPRHAKASFDYIDGILTDPSSLMALIAQNYHNVVYQIF